MRKFKFKTLLACFMALLMLINIAPVPVMADTEPEIWYTKNDITIDRHILFGENKMYTDGKSNRGFDCLVDNNTGTIFYVSTADSTVNYENLSSNGKEIMVTVHMSQPVVIDHFKIVAGADTFKANYAHRNPAGWNLKAGNSADSCNTVLVANKTVDASEGYKPNVYSFENTTPYQYYQFTITALAGAGRNGHDGPFSNPTATCTLADIAFGGPAPVSHSDHDDITFTKWDSTNSLPTTAGNYFLDKDITISSTWNVPSGTTNLCLNGHGIKKTGNGRAITVNGGANLNIYDCGNTTHYFDVTDHLATNINDTSGAQSFSGGYITGGNANGGDTENQRGGGIFVYSGGNFTMNGGTLIGNKSTNIGAAICSSPLNVSNNTSVITLNAGSKIMYNATPTNAAGGIYASGNVNLNGVQITNNYAGSNQIGGVNFNGKGTVTVSGATVVKDNYSGDKESNFGIEKTLQLGELTDGAYISMYSTSSYYGVNDGGAFTTENGKDYIDCFHVDSSRSDTYILGTTADGAIKMGKKFTVTWNDSDNSNLKTDELFKNDIPSYEGDTPKKLQDEFYTYTFAGWYDGTNSYGINDTFPAVTDNITYTALYTQTSVHNHNDATFEAWTKTDSLPTSAGNYVLANDITISSTWNVPSGTTNLCLNGHGITKTGTSGSVIRINSGATLKLHDCGTAEHYYYIGAASTYNSSCLGALVSSTSDSNYVNAERRGSFKGGYITGGYGTNYSNPGSTVFGGGVFVDGGSFVMNGGCIFGNRLSVRDGGNGGGGVAVRKSSSSFVMNGGYIIGNHAGRFGGGIRIDGGSFTMNGGEIRHNTANTPNSGGAGCGGGLHLGGLDGGPTVNITGGTIEGNYAGVKDGRGGGINVAGGTLTMTGGNVIGNNATLSGGGINGAFTLSGNAVVADNTVGGTFVVDSYKLNGGTLSNVNLSSGQKITLNGALTDGASIGIRLDDSKGTFTSGWNTNMSGKEPAEYFTSDNNSFDVLLDSNNEAEIGVGPAASIINGESTTKYTSFSDALSNWSEGSTLKLLKDATTNSTITVNGTKTLDLNGHGIRRTGTGCVIKVNEQSTLNLKDSDTSKEHKYKIASPAGNGAGVATVDDTLTSGYKTFKGGYITGGYITGGYNYGAGINVEGNGATLNMYGGTIIGNRLTAGSTGGGGVCLQDWDKSGGFNMYGGSIIGNTSNYGGGVYVRCGKTVMYDGEISNNVAHSNNIGGAVLAFGGNSTFIMEGGTINGNLAQHGGAIEASGDACVSIFGGTITNNTANGKGGALTNQRSDGDTSPAVFNISGAPVFSGNTAGGKSSDVYLCNTAVLNVTDEMTNTTPILVSRSNGSGTFTSGWKDKMGEADPAAYFTAEVSNYQVRRIRNGEAYVGPLHTHNWSYTANGDTITAKCSEYESGLCSLDTQTIQVVAEGKTYDGTAVSGSLTKSDDWKSDNGLSDPTIQYSGNTDAGTYTASITLGEATASTEFTIDEASMADEVSAQGCTVDYNGLSHSISVTSPKGSLVKYGTMEGTYILLNNPTYTNAGTYVVYYQVTRKNYITVTGSATVNINKINATVTITGNNSTVDYDGKDHKVTGYVAEASTNLYNVSKDFTFSGCDEATRKNAGQTDMGLAAEQFTNTNENFETVTFNVTDGYQKVDPIDVEVTIVGNNNTVDYDGTEHTVTGYVATADTELYDVDNDFTFSGNATASQTNAGQTNMNLAPEQFANINNNFKEVTFIVTDGYQKVNQINATVNITGHNDTLDYDGEEHSVSGFDAVASTNLYDVDNDFTFSGTEEIKRTDAGTTYLELDSSQFENTNPNFKTVTFIIDEDGYLTVNRIDATVIITGHNETVGYDDNAHSVTGYDAEASTPLYDVEKDFTFSGNAECERTDVGKTEMQLSADQFENINPNFATITFEITDGYIEVEKVDAVITKKPQRKSNFVYNGSKQTLLTDGTVWGGTLYYALGDDDKTAPADKKFKTEMPSAKEIGNYYVWYMVKADSNHYSLAPVCIKVTLADKDWVTVSGTVYQDNGEPEIGAEVTLISGNKTVDTILSDENGEYYFTVPTGVYNIVTSFDGKSQTTKVELYKDKKQNIDMLSTRTESIVKVKSDNDLGVVVDGLNQEAEAIRKADKLTDSQSLSLVMTVEAKTVETAKHADKFSNLSKNTTFEFFDISLEKTVDSKKTVLNSSNTILEIAVPYEKMNRKDIAAYYCDGSEVKKLKESNSREAGTYRIDKENGIVYIYSNEFATFAIGYTPYYQVDSALTLGSFKGNATVVMKGKNGEGTYTLKNVSPAKLSFDNIPKGEYKMTVTWVDGVENTLTVDVTVA